MATAPARRGLPRAPAGRGRCRAAAVSVPAALRRFRGPGLGRPATGNGAAGAGRPRTEESGLVLSSGVCGTGRQPRSF